LELQVRRKTDVTVFTFDYAEYHQFTKAGFNPTNLTFGSWYKGKHDVAIIYLPKSDALIDMVFSMTRESLEPGSRVYIVGQKNAGIKSQKPVIEKWFGSIIADDSARHSTIYEAEVTSSPLPNNSLDRWENHYEFSMRNKNYQAVTLPGVFSYGKLDEGTRMLLDTLPGHKAKAILDWGCGSGVIGLVAATMYPESRIDMVDSNALAIEATKRTLKLHNLTDVKVWASDIFSDITNTYDLILANPPFHSGIATDYHMVEQFIAQTKNHLNPHGALRIVANTFLRYSPLLKKQFDKVEVLSESKSYKVYEAYKTD
jgi:16S rRNA (guanine1207-N2)-methyltransferase